MEILDEPPSPDVLAKALKPVLADGLPLHPGAVDDVLLALRGVVARSINPGDRMNRIRALDELLKRLLVFYPDDKLGDAARILFGIAPGTRGLNLTDRREQAAHNAGYEAGHFRKYIEKKILERLALLLNADSQNYIPRGQVPLSLEASGDTPTIAVGDISSQEKAEHEEMLSRLWAAVYELRADILRAERLKTWPHDPTEPSTSAAKLAEALRGRDLQVQRVKVLIRAHLDTFGSRIAHGQGEYRVESLLRLAGWIEREG